MSSHKFPPFLTVREVSKLIRISESFIRHRIAEGRFPGVRRIGRAIRISLEELDLQMKTESGAVNLEKTPLQLLEKKGAEEN